MKDWFYAFFMAWGMFLAIPCPFPRWRESARGRMLVCLPLIGLVEGGLWALLVWLAAMLRTMKKNSARSTPLRPRSAAACRSRTGNFPSVCSA